MTPGLRIVEHDSASLSCIRGPVQQRRYKMRFFLQSCHVKPAILPCQSLAASKWPVSVIRNDSFHSPNRNDQLQCHNSLYFAINIMAVRPSARYIEFMAVSDNTVLTFSGTCFTDPPHLGSLLTKHMIQRCRLQSHNMTTISMPTSLPISTHCQP